MQKAKSAAMIIGRRQLAAPCHRADVTFFGMSIEALLKPTRIEEIDQQLEAIAQLGLTPTMQSILVKRLGEHKTHQEIAREEGISIGTSRKRFQRALQRIAPIKQLTCAN